MILKQLQSDLSPKYINPSEKKEQRVSMYRLKKLYDSIIDSTEKSDEINSVIEIDEENAFLESIGERPKKAIPVNMKKILFKSVEINSVISSDEENAFLDSKAIAVNKKKILSKSVEINSVTSFVNIETDILIPEKPKAIPVNIKINLSKSLTNSYLANRELFVANLSLPARKLREKKSLLNPTVLLNKNKFSSPKVFNFKSKKSFKKNKILEKTIGEGPVSKKILKINLPLENSSNCIMKMLEIKTELMDESIEQTWQGLDTFKTMEELTGLPEIAVEPKEMEPTGEEDQVESKEMEPEEEMEQVVELPEKTVEHKEMELDQEEMEQVVELPEKIVEHKEMEPTGETEQLEALPEITIEPKEMENPLTIEEIDKLSEIKIIMEEIIDKLTGTPEITNLDVDQLIKTQSDINSDIILNNNNSNSRNNNSLGIGEIFWAKLGKSPPWPSIVVDSADLTSVGNFGKSHVKFFNDSGRRGIVSNTQITPYNGLEKFLKTVSYFFFCLNDF